MKKSTLSSTESKTSLTDQGTAARSSLNLSALKFLYDLCTTQDEGDLGLHQQRVIKRAVCLTYEAIVNLTVRVKVFLLFKCYWQCGIVLH